ncbi:carbon-nitrogen hydrolase family protein [bacterium]|nr:carbon-nitrogen hydrolase family protein [bacterium]
MYAASSVHRFGHMINDHSSKVFGRYFIILVVVTAVILSGTVFGQPSRETILFQADTFQSVESAAAGGWVQYSQRVEISPEFFVAALPSIGGEGSLGISGASNSSANGCWRRMVTGISGGNYYRFEASYTVRSVPNPRIQVLARLDWRDRKDERIGQPEYIPDGVVHEGWQEVSGIFRAPVGTASVMIELHLGFCDQGTVWWDGIRLAQVPAPPKRIVRVGTVNCFPRNTASSTESVEQFCKLAGDAGKKGCDIVCLGEGINLVGVRGAQYTDIAEPIPGPTTQRLGEVARKWNMYIVAALGERDGAAVYNTGVLIDRQGRVAGIYHKVHLPREEVESGVTPGNSYPVFDTDFGRIGIMICWDNQYAEPARALAFQGAEIVFLPIWGGNATLTQARCIENQVYVVSCGYDIGCTIYDPWANLLAEAKDRPGFTVAEIDLNEPHPEQWLGNMRHRFYREMRADIPVPGLK